MNFDPLLNRLDKLGQALCSARLARALFLHRVLAGAEHRRVLARDLALVVDIGANRGQFALAARRWSPRAKVVAFEPLGGPAAVFRRVFAGDDSVTLHQAAIAPLSGIQQMHVSGREDSSSLLPIAAAQSGIFPGTAEVSTTEVRVAPLSEFLCAHDLPAPAMLKLDVQGYEYEALLGCEPLLARFDRVYCECSYVEFYAGQKLADEVIGWLAARGFHLVGRFNSTRDSRGREVQADFLFRRTAAEQPT
jgi:FkbM family methyltransferase